ncbi:hypothetical protein [Solitalea koreensis]|nr:hypothetical protein [Solitalea koreensis]
MQKIILTLKLSTLITLLIFVLPVSCKKGENIDPDDPGYVILLDKTSVTPGDLVTVTTAVTLDKPSWDIMIGDKKVLLSKVDDKTAVFVVPYIPAGEISLDFKILGIDEKPTLTITPYAPIANPDQVKDDYLTKLDEAIKDVSNAEDAYTLNVFKETFMQKYAALTTAEKQELAFSLEKIKFDLSALGDKAYLGKNGNNLSTQGVFDIPTAINSDQEYRAGVIAYVAMAIKSYSVLIVSANFCASPTGVTQVLGVAGLGASFYIFKKAVAYKRILLTYSGQNKKVLDLITLYVGSVNSTKTVEALAVQNSEIVFKTNQQRSFKVSSAYQGVSIADQTSSNEFFKNIVLVTNRATSAYNTVVNIVNSIKSWFSSDPKMIPVDNGIPTTSVEEVRNSPANLITIENISDPNIKLKTAAIGDVLKITAQSDVIKDKKAFTFDIVYNYPEIKVTNRKKISATYEPADGIGWYVGEYKLAVSSSTYSVSAHLGKTGPVYIFVYSYNGGSPGSFNAVIYMKSIMPDIPSVVSKIGFYDTIHQPNNVWRQNGGTGWDLVQNSTYMKLFRMGSCDLTPNEKITSIRQLEYDEWPGELLNITGVPQYGYYLDFNLPYQGKTTPTTLTATEQKAIDDIVAGRSTYVTL